MRVLILDDRAINRQYLATLLTYKGFETREANDGVEGLEIARGWPPDLAFVDIRMPRMDGVEFVKRMQGDPELARTAVIFYTASYETGDARRLARECGVSQVLMKPAEPERVLEAIDAAMGTKSSTGVPQEVERLEVAAMRATALVDFQLEITAQRLPSEILRILARAARTVLRAEHSSVFTQDTSVAGCSHAPCEWPPDAPQLRVPLESVSTGYGSLVLTGRRGGGSFTADDRRIAQTIAMQAAIAFENLSLYEKLREEAELLESNVNLLHATIEASGDGILVVDRNSRFVTFNQRFVEIMRVPEEFRSFGEANANLAYSMLHAKEPEVLRETIDGVRSGGEMTATFEMDDGRVVECHGAPRLLDGEVIGRVWTFRDVTASIRAATALRQSEEKYRSLVSNIPDVIWTANAADQIVFVSRNVASLFGFTADEVLADPRATWIDRIHPDDQTRAMESFFRLVEHQEPFDEEYRLQRKDGTWIWVQAWSNHTYERDGVMHADGVLHDVTARKEAEREVRRVLRELELLLESTGDGVFAVDVHGNCTLANRVAGTLLGWRTEELIGRRIHEMIRNDRRSFAVAKPTRIGEEQFLRSDGSTLPVEYLASPIVDADVVRGTVVTFTDITERRHLKQRLEQISRIDSLGRMAATIAHEFNNVLMGIQPFAEIVGRSAKDNPTLTKAANQIRNSITRGKTITHDILRVANVAEPELQSVDVTRWLEQLAGEVRALVGPRVRVDLDLPPAGTLFGRCDPGQLQQVITNLAVNARHAMDAQGTLRLAAARSGDEVCLEVADSGCGIDAKTLPFIFEPLFTTKHSGTGLGLAVAQQLVARNGGAIAVESVVGEGTKFRITLPTADAPEHLETEEDASPRTLGIERVLIIEDDAAVSAGLTAILEAEGVTVHAVERGADALDAIAAAPPDVVVIDVSLPDMSGTEVYKQIAARWPHIGVIFSTGHADEGHVPTGNDRVRFLRKPYSGDLLLSKLREVV